MQGQGLYQVQVQVLLLLPPLLLLGCFWDHFRSTLPLALALALALLLHMCLCIHIGVLMPLLLLLLQCM